MRKSTGTTNLKMIVQRRLSLTLSNSVTVFPYVSSILMYDFLNYRAMFPVIYSLYLRNKRTNVSRRFIRVPKSKLDWRLNFFTFKAKTKIILSSSK